MASKRDLSIDVMRGIAILTMVAANMSAYTLAPPVPFLFRFYGTFAAPLFIMLSGLMIALKGEAKEHDFKYYLVRGALVLAVAAAIDIFIWQTVPFIGVDVLYLIGISLPLAFLFLKLSTPLRWLGMILIFAAAPVLQNLFGYREGEAVFSRACGTLNEDICNAGIMKSWFVDGWFPVFPWLGFSFMGPVLQKLRLKSEAHLGTIKALLAGIATIVLGGVLWIASPGKLLIREGYSELFYPPTLGYIVVSIGVMVTLFSLVDRKPGLALYKPIIALGESSLFIYVLHLALIRYLLLPVWPARDFPAFILIYFVLMIFLVFTAYLLRRARKAWPARPFIVKFLMG